MGKRNVTSGTRLPDGTVVLKGVPEEINKVHCMACHGTAVPSTRPDGKRVYACQSCGREWVAKSF